MNVLQLLTRDHNRSGSGIQMMQLSLGLALRGHAVTCVYGYNPDHDNDFLPFRDSGVELKRVTLKSERLKAGNLSDVGVIREQIKNTSPDLIHTHSNAIDHAFLATLGMGVPIVANRGMSSPLKWKNALKYRSGKVVRIIAVSKNVKQVMCETGHIPQDKISVVYGSVDTQRFRPGIATPITRESLGIAGDTRVVGYTGSIGGRKGIDYLIDAFDKLHKQIPETVLLLVGIEEHQLAKRNIRISDELRPFVKFTGFQHQPELYMPLFDVFVFPGTRSEGLTGAIREAAAMAIPVVTTDIGGNRELIDNGDCGLVVKPEDSTALAQALKSMLTSEDGGRRMGQNGRAYVAENMSITHRVDQIESIYNTVLSRVC